MKCWKKRNNTIRRGQSLMALKTLQRSNEYAIGGEML
jgi:hypothetical protein